ncbi:MAG: prolipoprotein diacylglyceryl transferase [Candidatus Zapsychrus exili]|nr:prolipoprotein diacylglyceryl transferase [Candidatus Zapsychrus exili]
MIHHGGLAWQGSLVFGVFGGIWFIKRKGLSILKVLDLTAPYIALGQAIGRIGCFLNGCCYGKLSNVGIYYPVHQETLIPTQLYSSLGLFLIFLILKFYKKYSSRDGEVFVLYLIFALTFRFFIEFLRADHYEFLFGLSIYQLVCLSLFLISTYVYTLIKNKSRKSS